MRLQLTLTPGPSPTSGEGSWFPLSGERVRVRGCIDTATVFVVHSFREFNRDWLAVTSGDAKPNGVGYEK